MTRRRARGGGIAPCILNFCTRWKLVVSFAPRHPLERSLGGPQSRYRSCTEEIVSSPCRESNLDPRLPASYPIHYVDQVIWTPSFKLLFLGNFVNRLKPEIHLNLKIQFLAHRKHTVSSLQSLIR
jgi:hypothetical protein